MDFGDFATVPKWVFIHPRCQNCTRPLYSEKRPTLGLYHTQYIREEMNLNWGFLKKQSTAQEGSQKILQSSVSPFSCFLCEGKQGVCHNVALPFTLKSILKQKKNYGKLKYISPCKNIIFKKKSS
jgi:hypothetical protein